MALLPRVIPRLARILLMRSFLVPPPIARRRSVVASLQCYTFTLIHPAMCSSIAVRVMCSAQGYPMSFHICARAASTSAPYVRGRPVRTTVDERRSCNRRIARGTDFSCILRVDESSLTSAPRFSLLPADASHSCKWSCRTSCFVAIFIWRPE